MAIVIQSGAQEGSSTGYSVDSNMNEVSLIVETANTWIPVQTFNSSINFAIAQTTLTGTTAGSAIWSMPFQGASYKKVIIYFSAYENDTTTAQSITYPTAFVHTPIVSSNGSGLSFTSTISVLTITAPDATTTYTGFVIIEGY